MSAVFVVCTETRKIVETNSKIKGLERDQVLGAKLQDVVSIGCDVELNAVDNMSSCVVTDDGRFPAIVSVRKLGDLLSFVEVDVRERPRRGLISV